MDEGRRQALRINHQKLRSGLIVENILPDFRPYLTDIEYVRLESQTGNVAQVDELVAILLTKENRHFDDLCRVLEHNGYRHWAQQLKADASGRADPSLSMMDEGRKQALRSIQHRLRTGMLVKNILPTLRPYLTDIEYSQVRDQTGNVDQVDELVAILLTKENRHFDGLCRVLEHNEYQYWALQLKAAAGAHRPMEETVANGT